MNNEEQIFAEPMPDEPEKTKQSYNNILAYLRDFVSWLAGILLVFMLLFRVVVVSGPSMLPTLQHGDCLILLNGSLYGEPKQGDIIVIAPEDDSGGDPIIKRVIATEGQRVNIHFDAGIVLVDGVPLDEPYVNTPTNLDEGVQFPLTVEEGCIFVLGDNRNSSKDSRNPEIGQIDCRRVLGKALLLAFPGKDSETKKIDFGRIGVID